MLEIPTFYLLLANRKSLDKNDNELLALSKGNTYVYANIFNKEIKIEVSVTDLLLSNNNTTWYWVCCPNQTLVLKDMNHVLFIFFTVLSYTSVCPKCSLN